MLKQQFKLFSIVKILFLLTSLASCTHFNSPEKRLSKATTLAKTYQWESVILPGKFFDLAAFLPEKTQPHSQLVIYLEGDGLAWKNRQTISANPTPPTPLALQLALTQPEENAVYLARPCQFVTGINRKNCINTVWTRDRFSEDVISATDDAVTQLKLRFNAESLVLVGYSGGGAVACLVAARRHDVKQLITVAGNLNHKYWTYLQNVSPLTGSLNPTDFRTALNQIPQIHLVGEKDKNIPPVIADNFVRGLNIDAPAQVIRIPEFDHQCCWARDWKNIYTNLIEKE